MDENLMIFSLLIASFRLATPLIFASLGGFLSERSGVIQIALEGFMLVGAFTGAVAASTWSSSWLGWMVAFVAGVLTAAVFAFFVLELATDQIVAGTAFNLMISGAIPFAGKIIYNSTGSTPSIPLEHRFLWQPLPMAVVLILILHWWFTRTSSGLWVKFAGEKPEALESSGISSRKIRWICVCLAGGVAAWGGASLSLFLASSYSPLMTSGRGFIALSALIFGRWKPFPTALACLLFGFTEALQIHWQGAKLFGFEVPVQWIQILPYIVTIVALAGFVGNYKPPRDLGKTSV